MSDSESESSRRLVRDLGKKAVAVRDQRNQAYSVIRQMGEAHCNALHPLGYLCRSVPGHPGAQGHHSFIIGRWHDHLKGAGPSPWTEEMLEVYYEAKGERSNERS